MEINVGKISNTYFMGAPDSKKRPQESASRPKVNELSNITSPIAVNLPQKYTLTNKYKLENGQEIFCYKLANGFKVSVIPMEGASAVVKNYVNVGSLNETPDIKGISHFLEHMAFNGTNGENGHIKLEVGDSFKKVDEMGGWANASTNYAITDYINSTRQLHDNDIEKQIQIIAAMTEDLKLSDEMIEKEKGPVCSEINMILDDPQTIAFDQTVRTLFNIKSPADELVGGSVKHIKNLTRKDVLDYYNKYYTPDNMNLVVSGDVNQDEVIKIVAKSFNSKKVPVGKKFEEKLTPLQKSVRKDFVSDKTSSAQIILGFTGPQSNNTRDKVLFDVVKDYLKFDDLRTLNVYPHISNDKISTNPYNPEMIFIGMKTSDSKVEDALKEIFNTIGSTKKPSEEKLNSIKSNFKRSIQNMMEYSEDINNWVGKAVLSNDIDYVTEYNNILDSITPEEVKDGINRFFDLNKTAITVVHPQKAQELTFKGKVNSKERMPINLDKVSEYKLRNNFDVGFYETKNNNIYYSVSLNLNDAYHKKPAVVYVLDMLYSMGTAAKDESAYYEYLDNNGISLYTNVERDSLCLSVTSGFENRKLAYEEIKNVLHNPPITEDNLKIAKDRVKAILKSIDDSADGLVSDYLSKSCQYRFSKDEAIKAIDSITLDDVKDCRDFLLKNANGVVVANLPENSKETVKKEILKEVSSLPKVLSVEPKQLDIYKKNEAPVVLTKANHNSQADIEQVNMFKFEETPKNYVLASLVESILTSSSIGLFDTLREKEHLAYSVSSNFDFFGNEGSYTSKILTTTDNKEIGEVAYDNVKKSINGFNRQINELKNGKFTAQDLENAKLNLKSRLLNSEGVGKKLTNLERGMKTKYGITYRNQIYKTIDTITRDDVLKFANMTFKNPPIYSIVASQDTLDNNKDFFDSLKG